METYTLWLLRIIRDLKHVFRGIKHLERFLFKLNTSHQFKSLDTFCSSSLK